MFGVGIGTIIIWLILYLIEEGSIKDKNKRNNEEKD